MSRAIGVDLGGTKLAAGLVDRRGMVVQRDEIASHASDADALCADIVRVVSSLDRRGIAGVGIGAAGIIDFADGRFLYGPNLPLRDVDLAKLIGAELGTNVIVDNDANTAAWGEYRFGSGRGTKAFLCVTLGTGIGGGIVANGAPYRGARGGAAEIGHMLVDPDGPVCGCGRRGCWEQYASGKALERIAREELVHETSSAVYRACGGDPSSLRGPMVTAAARAGDRFACDLLGRVARWFGWGLASLVNILEPERIAVGGGMSADWDLIADDVIAAMRERIEGLEYRVMVPEVVVAQLGNDAGIVGAASLLM